MAREKNQGLFRKIKVAIVESVASCVMVRAKETITTKNS